MKKLCLSIILLLSISILQGQEAKVTFKLDTEDLVEKNIFSTDTANKVFILGTFNNWKGTDYQLKRIPDSEVYEGSFNAGNIGDTISYKFVIQKNGGHYFYESNPNTDNPDNGNRTLILTEENMELPAAHFSCDEYFSYPVIFSEKKLKEDYLQFREILESTHPALYDYMDKSTLDSLFDNQYQKINSDMEFNEFLILMTEIISKVGCGHTSLWVPYAFWKIAPERLFPLKLIISNNKVYVSGCYEKDQQVPVGSEVKSINDQNINHIITRLAALTSTDGFNPSYRKEKVAQNFSVKFAHAFGFPENFIVSYLSPGSNQLQTATLQPVSKQTVDNEKPEHKELSFYRTDEENIGKLTINTFGYYGEVDMFKRFIDSVFSEIKKHDVQYLIMDLRHNSGGDPFCSSYLWGYLQTEPLPYFKDHYGRYDTLADPIPLPRNHYTGELYTLIDGNGFSTTGHFCGLLKYHKVGTFIGAELGSTYTCTGNATYPPLENTGIMVGTARITRYTTAVKNMDPTRGVMPDFFVEPTQEDIISGKDVVMDFTIELIRSVQE